MASNLSTKLRLPLDDNSVTNLSKTLVISGLVLYLFYTFFLGQSGCPSADFSAPWLRISSPSRPTLRRSPTNISHLVFGLVGSVDAWRHRKAYIESWWRPNVTRGYVFLDTAPTAELLPWSPDSPPLRVSDDTSGIVQESKHVAPVMVRMVHAISEVFRERDGGVRWPYCA
ncbi:hypothetical protein U1Q18_032319 [Sarracenia purpurea var. burkii]